MFLRELAPFKPFTDYAACHAVVSRLFKIAGIEMESRIFGMHMLRHNATSTMVKNEVPIETIAAILSAYTTDTIKHRRNRMMLIMLYDTGARAQELADLNISSLHLDVQNPFVTLKGKGRISRNVPLLNKTVLHLNEYLKEFHPYYIENPLFFSILNNSRHRLSTDSISLILKIAADKARETCRDVPDHVHCHMMRKTKAMDLYKNSVPLPFIM